MLEGGTKSGKIKAKLRETWAVSCIPDTKADLGKIVPWDFPLVVLQETKDWLVVDKPLGISVHPSASENSQETILNALVARLGIENLADNFDEVEGQKISRPGLVHRLDKTTSGVLLVAKNNQTHRFFMEHWGECEKFYVALVQGKPPLSGRISGGIVRDTQNRTKMTVQNSDKSRAAETLFWREDFNPQKNISRMKVQILTGRTHQIRAHFASIGFSILGDEKYGGEKADRIFLHAHKLKFPNLEKEGGFIEVVSAVPETFL